MKFRLLFKCFCASLVALFSVSGFALEQAQKERFFAYRSFMPEFEAMKDFAKQGVNTICLMPSNTTNSLGEPYCGYPPFWRFKGGYDWKTLDKQFDDILAANPNASLICIIDLNSAPWLMRRMSFAHTFDSDSFSMLSNSVVCKYWRTETEQFLKDYLKHLEEKFGDKIKAYMLACGHTDEWLDYDYGIASQCKLTAWHKWLKKNKKDIIDVPPISRLYKAEFENVVRSPKTEGDCVDYIRFINDSVADALIDFGKIARKTIAKDKQLGAFFGYIHRHALDGHLEYERVYANENFDFFVSPGLYKTRMMGQASGFMCADGTRRRLGKGWLHEIDHRTHTYNHQLSEYVRIVDVANWKNQEENDAGLKREFSVATIGHSSLWCFDMWGSVFKTPETLATVKNGHRVWDKFRADNSPKVAEIAVFADPQSLAYVNQMRKGNFNHAAVLRDNASAIGAPIEIFSFSDIGKVDLSKYKLLMFPQSFMITPERKALLEKYAMKDGKTILTIYAPAIVDGENLDVENVKKFTGFDFGAKGVNQKDMGGWRSVYICDVKDATPEVIRDIAESAGVHFYSDELIPIHVNEKLLCVHVKDGGKKKISLPQEYRKVTEMFTGKVVAQDASEFVYDFASPDTALFFLEK